MEVSTWMTLKNNITLGGSGGGGRFGHARFQSGVQVFRPA